MKIAQIITIISAGCLLLSFSNRLSAQVIPTREWVSFYSSDTRLNGELVPVGSIISAYDPEGQLCGIDTVKINGHYGFLQVYGDDPTTLNRQGPDVGSQYRSAIFYHSDKQKDSAIESRDRLRSSGKYKRDIVTEIKPASAFYMAEDYHQQYLAKRGLASFGVR